MKEINLDLTLKDPTVALDVNIEYSYQGAVGREQIYIKPITSGYGVYRYNEMGLLVEVLYESEL